MFFRNNRQFMVYSVSTGYISWFLTSRYFKLCDNVIFDTFLFVRFGLFPGDISSTDAMSLLLHFLQYFLFPIFCYLRLIIYSLDFLYARSISHNTKNLDKIKITLRKTSVRIRGMGKQLHYYIISLWMNDFQLDYVVI